MWMTPALLLAVFATSTGRAEWNQFRGPNSSGVAASGKAYPAEFSAEKNLVWRASIGRGNSSPCLFANRIFVTAEIEGGVETICFDRTTGAILWREAVEIVDGERMHEINSAASSTPAADAERVYVHFGPVGVIAYDHDGDEVWRKKLSTPRNTFGSATSPILHDGKLIVVRDTNAESWVEVLNAEDGETLWRKERDGFKSGWSTPIVWQRGELQELLVYGVWWLTAYDLKDGSQRWAVPGLTDEPIVTPVTSEGLVYVSSYNMNTNPEVIGLPEFSKLVEEHDANGDGQLNREEIESNKSILSRADADGEGDHPLRIFFRFLDEDRDGQITSTEWQKIIDWLGGMKHANALLAIKPGAPGVDPEVVWQHPRGVPECPSPLAIHGRVFVVKNGGLASAFDARTGELAYQGRIGARGPFYASPVAADGKIYTASARGVVTVLNDGSEMRVLSKNDLGERIMATPALSDGVVYVRTDESLFAFGLED